MDLKHYGRYIRYIKAYCSAIHLSLEFSNKDDEGAYIPSLRKIRVDPDLPESSQLAVLLHELGHVLDDTLLAKKKFRQMERAYMKVYSHKCSKKQKRVVYRAELRAWEYGRVIAKILDIRLGKWYDKYRSKCLQGYRK